MVDSELIPTLDRLRILASLPAAPPDDPWALASYWLTGAMCQREWPRLRAMVRGGLDDSIKQANALADRLRTYTANKSWFNRGSVVPEDVVGAADTIAIDLLNPKTPSLAKSLTARGDAVVAGLPPEARSLAELLDAVNETDGNRDRNERDWAETETALAPLTNGLRIPAATLAAAAVAWHLTDVWARIRPDRPAWATLKNWLTDWFARTGLVGELTFEGAGNHPAAACRIEFECLPGIVHATLSLSLRQTPEASPWRAMPAPPDCGRAAPVALKQFLADPDPTREPAARIAFAEALKRPEGADWFDALLQAAASADGPEAVWWFFLRGRQWIRAFPDLDREAGVQSVRWPTSAPLLWPRVVVRRSPLTAGVAIQIHRYSPDPAGAEAEISASTPEPGSALDIFCRWFESDSDREALWGGNRWATAHAISVSPGDPRQAMALADAWYTALAEDAATHAQMEAWLHAVGIEVIQPERAGVGEVEERIAFGERTTSQRGYKTAAGVLRPAVRVVDGGPEPHGFGELQQAAAALPAATGLPGAVARLAEAGRGGYLAESALELFALYWDHRPAKPDEPTLRFGNALNAFLQALGFEPFEPKAIHDHPDGWVSPTPGSRLVSGGIRRVYRPGLVDVRGEMRIPALAEVD